ncbi:hypothetical protein [Romboutsia lituseburensis]|nr:hypothetical protein [Romboutsia lituseburensis]
MGKLKSILIKGGAYMLNQKNSFNHMNGNQVNGTRLPLKAEHQHDLRESHKLENGIRKDKKTKMNRKFT